MLFVIAMEGWVGEGMGWRLASVRDMARGVIVCLVMPERFPSARGETVVIVEQATAPTDYVSRSDYEIAGRLGVAFHNYMSLSSCTQSGGMWVSGMQGGRSEDRPSVQLFAVEHCSRPEAAPEIHCR